MRGVDERIRELELQLLDVSEHYLESRESQMASLDATLAQFGDQVGAVPARELEYARLRREQELLGNIYRQLQIRLHEVEVEDAVEPLDVQLLDPALVPERPSSPRRLVNLFAGTFLGITLGLLTAFGRHAFDTKVRSRNDVRLASRGLPVIATIPRIRPAPNGRRNSSPALPMLGRGGNADAATVTLVARDTPRSPAAEAYRALRTHVFVRRNEDSHRTLIITSAVTGEGKSSSAANLAVTLAQQGLRTLLIDADLHDGSLNRIFEVGSVPGLAEVLQEKVSLDDAVKSVDGAAGNLDLITCGSQPNNPAELMGGDRLQLVLNRVLRKYDWVVFDTPPLAVATDAAILGLLPNVATLIVVRAGFSDRQAVEHVSQTLLEFGVRVQGVILNDVPPSDAPAYGYGPGTRVR